ncbi:sodium:solute symporter family transporter [Bacillus sp. B-jedd]|uniref:sodium:solute symporter family transporter n=1 Tax=Bacillus sp. B-jedd TaxID=1476857 RepID=UPI00051567E6|nr:membrane protein [Bacillus sp. B-jedd]CEG25776.1 sodium:solute symporter family permease [Bacillus sp. B-jedd]
MKRANFPYFINGSITLGLSFGIVSLLARWVTGNTILSSPETLIKYGLLGGIGYALMGGLSLFLFGFLAKKIRRTFSGGLTIGDVLKERLSPAGYWYMISALILLSLNSMFVQAMGAGILIHTIFPIPVFPGLALFLAFCLFIGGIGGMRRIHKLAGINVTLIFAAVIIIPLYFYIQEGVRTVFVGIKLYHPYILFFKNKEAIWFLFTAILVGFGQIVIDGATWQRVFMLKKEKVQLTFALTGLIWATVPLALSSLLMIIIFGRGYENIYSLVFELVDKIQPTILILLFVLFCFSAISSALSSELQATAALFSKNVIGSVRSLTDSGHLRIVYIFSGLVCLFLLVAVSILMPRPLELLFFFGNVYAAMIPPMIYIILSKNKVPSIIPFSSLIGGAGGYILLAIAGDLNGIWVSFGLSFVLCLSVLVYKSFKNFLVG